MMSQYKISIYFLCQFGLNFRVDEHFVEVNLPFISVMYGRDSDANGYFIFGKEIE